MKTILPFFLFCLSILCSATASAEIKSRIHEDGSIEFYNTHSGTKGPRANLSSIYDRAIELISAQMKIDPYLVKAVIKVESDFRPNALSHAGAMGLMQLMKGTADLYGVSDPFDPVENLNAGTRHLAFLLNRFHNNTELALAAYHAGTGPVAAGMSVPQIDETIAYVNRVMALYTGDSGYRAKVKVLRQRLSEDGTLFIYSR